MKHKIFILFAGILSVFTLHSQQLSIQEASVYAKQYLNKNGKTYSIKQAGEINVHKKNIAYLFRLAPQGFILVSNVKTRNPIIGFSWKNNFSTKDKDNNPLFSILEGIHRERKALSHHPDLDIIRKTKSFIVGPHVYTLWGQVNCHDASGNPINVTNYNTPNHCAVGCVAISLSTILHYYQWPPKGKGSHSYYDGNGSLTGNHSANYYIEYPWELMKKKYNNQNSTLQEQQAAGLLAYHSAVGVNMNFENGGSTSNVNKIPYALNHFFRFNSYYKNINSANFWIVIDKNMIEANPVAIAVENNSGGGHSMIIDGLKVEDNGDRFYHLNCGWWGTTNGWYALQGNFNAGTYTSILGGVVDVIPAAYIPQQSYSNTGDYTLKWQFSNTIEANSFKVQQKINDEDWVTLAEEVADTSLTININDTSQNYYFRVKAKVNGEYYPYTWSNTMQLDYFPVGIRNTTSPVPQISPNPVKNILHISNIAQLNKIEIYSMNAILVFQQNLNETNSIFDLDVSHLKKGVYFINLIEDNKQTIKKIVKQ